MRTRTTLGSACPIIVCREKAWNQGTTPYSETQNNHPFFLSDFNWTVPNGFLDSSESITDDTGTDGAFRPCLHTYESNAFFAPDVIHRCFRGYKGNHYVHQTGTNRTVTLALALRTAPSIDYNAYAEQAMAFMLPRLNEGLSLVNFVLELKDLKRMDPRGTLSRLRHRHLAIRDLSNPHTRKRFQKELVTRLNNAALNTSFGIVPFVADLVQIYDDLTSLASRLEGLKKYANTPQQRHYKRVIPESQGVPATRNWKEQLETINWASGIIQDNLDNGGLRRPILMKRRGRWIKRPVYHATMRYKYTLPGVDSRLEEVYAFLDTLGVRLDPSIIWNAIPFSFVVDWIVDVSGFLGSFARDNYPIEVTLLDFCHSYSWHAEYETYCSWICDLSIETNFTIIKAGYPTRPGEVNIFRGVRSSYNRVRAFPSIHTARIKGPKLRHAALSLSLLLAQTSYGRANRYSRDLSSTFLRVKRK